MVRDDRWCPSDMAAAWTGRLRRWLRLARRGPGFFDPSSTASYETASGSRERSRTPFLGPNEFSDSGKFLRKPNEAEDGGEAVYRGSIVVTNLARGLVKAILPSGSELSLAKNRSAPDLHPVMYLCGHQERTRWIINNETLMTGESYKELMLLVPFVQKGDGPFWHNYVVRMYLNHGIAIRIGNDHFGYAKEFGTLCERDIDPHRSEVKVSDRRKTLKFRARSTFTGSWRRSANARAELPHYPSIMTILAMPVVGLHHSGRLICSYFELDDRCAWVAPIESTHEFVDPFVPAMSSWMGIGPLSNVVNGAVAVRGLQWRIDHPPPADCRF
jgi:hypothetical protein